LIEIGNDFFDLMVSFGFIETAEELHEDMHLILVELRDASANLLYQTLSQLLRHDILVVEVINHSSRKLMQIHFVDILNGKGISHLGKLTYLSKEDMIIPHIWAAFKMHGRLKN
jgi:hypothetical protein